MSHPQCTIPWAPTRWCVLRSRSATTCSSTSSSSNISSSNSSTSSSNCRWSWRSRRRRTCSNCRTASPTTRSTGAPSPPSASTAPPSCRWAAEHAAAPRPAPRTHPAPPAPGCSKNLTRVSLGAAHGRVNTLGDQIRPRLVTRTEASTVGTVPLLARLAFTAPYTVDIGIKRWLPRDPQWILSSAWSRRFPPVVGP